jgi:hypothetical protein
MIHIPGCSCIFQGVGNTMDSSNCVIHKSEAPYGCDHCPCDDYRPDRKPKKAGDSSGSDWPVCVCGHDAWSHNT